MRITDVKDREPPHGNTAIWRYCGIEKFLALVTSNRLFLSPASNFSDELDATIPERTLSAFRQRRLAEGLTPADVDREIDTLEARGKTLVNCWSINRNESYALWKIYLGGSSYGVAIRSTVGRLRKALSAHLPDLVDRLYLGQVKYTDYLDPDALDPLRVVLTKNHFYEFEQELRVVATVSSDRRGRRLRNGYGIHISAEDLVEKIFVSPFAQAWFQETLRAVLNSLNPALAGRLAESAVKDQ